MKIEDENFRRLFSEVRKIVGLAESLRLDIKTDQRAATGDTQAMMQNPVCRELLSIYGAWLWETDENHRFRYISPQFNTVVNDDYEYFLSNSRVEMIEKYNPCSKRESLTARRHLELLNSHREFHKYKYEVELPSCGRKWFEVSGYPKRDIQSNKFEGYWGVGIDVTGAMEREIAERRRLEEFGAAFNSLDVSILMLDPAQRISYRNERWLSLHERLPSEFTRIGAKYRDYIWASIEKGLFPEANGHEDDFVERRLEQNANPPLDTIKMQRQDGIVLSIKITKLNSSSTLIISNDITNWTH